MSRSDCKMRTLYLLVLVYTSLVIRPTSADIRIAQTSAAEVALDSSGATSILPRKLQITTPVSLSGFTQPTSMHWTPDQAHVYVAEKAGIVYKFNSFVGTKAAAPKVLDIQGQTFTYGDHGLTSILVDANGEWLYATYSHINPAAPDEKYTCNDFGEINRPFDQIQGCTTWGMFSRWPLNAAGDISGPEQIIINGMDTVEADGETTTLMCSQFSSHPITSIAQNPATRELFVAAADGASFTIADYGQLGANPCMDRAKYGGAFRAQDPVRLNGKIGIVNPDSLEWRVYSTGHRNPWRISWDIGENQLLEAESGWFAFEEINVIEDGKNYGWPCREGPEATPNYGDTPLAPEVCPTIDTVDPQFSYPHPRPPPPGDVLSISAIAAYEGDVYFGEYVEKRLDSLQRLQNDQVVLSGVAPVELRLLPSGTLAFVDYDRGRVQAAAQGQPIDDPVAGPGRGTPTVRIIPGHTKWTAGSGAPLTFTGVSSAEGREGQTFVWRSVLTNCATDDECLNTTIEEDVQGNPYTVGAPATAGTLVVEMQVSSFGGFQTTAKPYVQPSEGYRRCPCLAAEDVGGAASSGLSAGAITGIALGAAAVVGLVALAMLFFLRGRRTGSNPQGSPVSTDNPAGQSLAQRRNAPPITALDQPTAAVPATGPSSATAANAVTPVGERRL